MDNKGWARIELPMQHNEVRTEVRQFLGLWIPVEILRLDITPTEKLLWADIHSFTGRNASFFKSNARIAQEYGISVRTASRSVTALVERGLITSQTDGRMRTLRSRLDNVSMQPSQIDYPAEPNCLHSNTGESTKRKQVSRAKPNNRQDVYIFFNEMGLDSGEADKFVDYYEANGWKQGRGKSIKDWKAAARNWNRNAKQWNNKPRGFNAGNFTTNGAIDFVTGG